jgi:hypothetical protein
MTYTRAYILTEEIARQAVEVIFRDETMDWHVAFSNPTAGPWKLIRLQIGGSLIQVGTYLKEELRPDLILQSAANRLLLVLEAKRSIAELLRPGQLAKTVGVFAAETERLAGLLSDHGQDPHAVGVGFIYPSYEAAADRERLRSALLPELEDASSEIDAYVTMIVQPAPSGDLGVAWHVDEVTSAGSSLEATLGRSLPASFARELSSG